MAELGETMWSLIAILLAGATVVTGFWDAVPLSTGALELIGVPVLLAGRHPG